MSPWESQVVAWSRSYIASHGVDETRYSDSWILAKTRAVILPYSPLWKVPAYPGFLQPLLRYVARTIVSYSAREIANRIRCDEAAES